MSEKNEQVDAYKRVLEAKSMIDAAEKAGRKLSSDEKADVESALHAGDEVLADTASAEQKSKVDALADALGQPNRPQVKAPNDEREVKDNRSLGTQFTESPEYKALMERGLKGDWSTGGIEFKTTLTEGAGSGAALVNDQVLPGILPLKFERLTVADLLAQGSTNNPSINYMKETTATNAATTVAEGAAKPESALVFDEVTDPVRKIATTLPVTDEMLADGPAIRAYIDGRLRLFVQLAEESQLLSGTAVAPDIVGLLNRTGIQTQALGADTKPDAAYKAMQKIRDVFLEPDGMVINPSDWTDFKLMKDSAGNYFGGGPFGQTGAVENLWGMRVVVTSRITAGTALIGAFGTAAQIFRRQGITLDATNSHASEFVSNITRIRAEERLALAVYRPAAFVTLTGI